MVRQPRSSTDGDLKLRVRTAVSETERVPAALIKELDEELDHNPSVDLWILRGDVIQLCEDGEYDLDDARESYIKAIALDPQSADAFESLAHFTFAVNAAARDSLQYFQRAIELGAGQSAREGLHAATEDLAEDDKWE